jgi:hypothetical protein
VVDATHIPLGHKQASIGAHKLFVLLSDLG